ncbi:hypothetical protein [Streptomyces wuyuanensis]
MPSAEGVRHLRSQGWTYERIATEYGMKPRDVYWMLRNSTRPKGETS